MECANKDDESWGRRSVAVLEKREDVVEFIEVAVVELRGVAQPREIAELVVFLASDESLFITAAAITIEAGHSAW